MFVCLCLPHIVSQMVSPYLCMYLSVSLYLCVLRLRDPCSSYVHASWWSRRLALPSLPAVGAAATTSRRVLATERAALPSRRHLRRAFCQFLSPRPPITQNRVRHQDLELPVQFLLDMFLVFTLLNHLDCLQLHLFRIAGPPVGDAGVGSFSRFTWCCWWGSFWRSHPYLTMLPNLGSLLNVGGWTMCV